MKAKLHEKYLIGDLAKLQEKEILKSLKLGSVYPGAYFLTQASNRIEQLDIVDSLNYFSAQNEKRMEIVGIAYGKQEALLLLKKIADRVYRDHAAGSIREYFGGGK